MWKFPVGKLKENEDTFQYIIREIKEKLSVDFIIKQQKILSETIHEYENFIVHFYTIKGKIYSNSTFAPNDHDAFIWLKRKNLSSIVWAPADIPTIENYLIVLIIMSKF